MMLKRPCPDGPLPDGSDDLTAGEMDSVCGGLNPPQMVLKSRVKTDNGIIVDDGAPI